MDFTKNVLPHIIAVILFLGLAAIYFFPQFQGKVVQQGDIIQYQAMSKEIRDYEARTGEWSLWTNAMFGGMPTYQIRTVQAGNQLWKLDKVARLGIAMPTGQFLVAMLGFYVLLIVLGVNPWLSMVGAIAFAFTTNSISLYEAGHETKLKAISYFPLIAAGLILAFRGRYIWGGLLFGLGLGLDLTANHIQMTYYLFLTVIIYGIAQFIHDLRGKSLANFGKAAAALTVGGLLAIASVASNLWITYEYAADTMRGEPILETTQNVDPMSSSATEGLSWDYAMRWSNGVIDLVATFIPGAAGGGSQEPLDANSAIYQSLRSKGYNIPTEFEAPLYWGPLPFTSAPAYIGAAVVFFFVMGLFLVKGPLKWWLALGTLLTFMLSMGHNLEFFNRLIFDYFPLYNKFRTPNSIMSVPSFLMPLLGLLALHKIVAGKVDRPQIDRAIKIGAGVVGGLALFYALLGPSLYSFTSPNDAQYAETFGMENLIADRQALMRADALRTLLWVGACVGVLWLYLRNNINTTLLAIGLGAIVLLDLWGVNKRYLDREDFTQPTNVANNFTPRPVDQEILRDTDPNYRVFDATVNTFNSAQGSYFHKMVGGYHAAKLQRYQDIIDRYLSQGDPGVLNMLNTRYIIVPGQNNEPMVQRNPAALGNAWLVDSLAFVPSADAEIAALGQVELGRVAVVHEEFRDYVQGLNPTGQGSVQLTEYRPNGLTYTSNTSSEELIVFSEIWYGPDKGWQAYIDDQPVEHIRVNYLLRALRVPAGQHRIEFRFAPRAYQAGITVSLIASLLLLLSVLGLAGYQLYQERQRPRPEPVAPTTPTPTERAKPTRTAKPKRKKK